MSLCCIFPKYSYIYINQIINTTPTEKQRKSFYEELRADGITRKDFLKFCATMAAMLGLESSGIGQIAKALETKPHLPVIWFHFQECTCCSESFIRTTNPGVADIILEKISLDYQETLMAASGFQAEEAYQAVMKKYPGQYLGWWRAPYPREMRPTAVLGAGVPNRFWRKP